MSRLKLALACSFFHGQFLWARVDPLLTIMHQLRVRRLGSFNFNKTVSRALLGSKTRIRFKFSRSEVVVTLWHSARFRKNGR
jgi:hypothetical protein